MAKREVANGPVSLAEAAYIRRRSLRSRVLRLGHVARKKPVGTASLLVMVALGLAAALAPFLGTTDLFAKDNYNQFAPPSTSSWFGTDKYGRDFYTQMVYGARVSFMVAFLSIGLGSSAGLALGVVSGYFGGWVDLLMQRFTDVMLSFPSLMLALAIMAGLGVGLDKVIIAIALVEGPRMLRIIRGDVLSVKENTYVEAARAIGAGPLRIMVRHVTPGVTATYLVYASLLLGTAVLMEASLSYLGMGVPPPNPSWGRLLSGNAVAYAFTAPWLMLIPGIAITVLILAFNLLGDTLRDVWDPRLRGR